MAELKRKCFATGVIRPTGELLRFALTPDNCLLPDFDKKSDGRGLYLSNAKTLLDKAVDKHLFAKALRQCPKMSKDIAGQVETLLYQRGLAQIKRAKKTGTLVAGSPEFNENIDKNKVAFVVEATDASAESTSEIKSLFSDDRILKAYTMCDLRNVLDLPDVSYFAVLKSNMAKRAYDGIKKYQTFMEN